MYSYSGRRISLRQYGRKNCIRPVGVG